MKKTITTALVVLFLTVSASAFAAPTLEYEQSPELSKPQTYLIQRAAILSQVATQLASQNGSIESFRTEIEAKLGTGEDVWNNAVKWAASHGYRDVESMINQSVMTMAEIERWRAKLGADHYRVETLRMFQVYEETLLRTMAFELKYKQRWLQVPKHLELGAMVMGIGSAIMLGAQAMDYGSRHRLFGELAPFVFISSAATFVSAAGLFMLPEQLLYTEAVSDLEQALRDTFQDQLPTTPDAVLQKSLQQWASRSDLHCEKIFSE